MDALFVISGVVLAIVLGLVIFVTAILWKRGKEGTPQHPGILPQK